MSTLSLFTKAALLLAMTAISTTLIIASSQRQSLTIDEANHLNCGTEWLQYHTYTLWPENPPLSRMAVALGPYLDGHRIERPQVANNKSFFEAFVNSYSHDYYDNGEMTDRLFWSRIFIIPFFVLSLVIVWTWTNSIAGENAALIGTTLYAFLPPVLAHSGLGTTDISFMATFILALWTFTRWLEKPEYLNAIWCGLAIALCLVTKFSILVFFPMCALPLTMSWLFWGIKTSSWTYANWFRSILRSGFVLSVVTVLGCWAFFGFDAGLLGDQPMIQVGIKEDIWKKEIATVWVPAPEWVTGLLMVIQHHKTGALVFVNGELTTHGVPYFYLATTILKTPLPFLLFMLVGLIGAWKSKYIYHWQAKTLAALPWIIAVLGLFSTINYGIRHILIIYPLAAVGAACGLIWLIESYKPKTQRLIVGTFLIAQLTIAATVYPNYLPYFNFLAGNEPGKILNDSDLDWGQGLYELSDYCKENQIDTLWLSYQGLMNTCWYPTLPVVRILPTDTLVSGWVAVSEMHYRGVFQGQQFFETPECRFLGFTFQPTPDFTPHKRFRWLDQHKLNAKVAGGSIRLYHIANESGLHER